MNIDGHWIFSALQYFLIDNILKSKLKPKPYSKAIPRLPKPYQNQYYKTKTAPKPRIQYQNLKTSFGFGFGFGAYLVLNPDNRQIK